METPFRVYQVENKSTLDEQKQLNFNTQDAQTITETQGKMSSNFSNQSQSYFVNEQIPPYYQHLNTQIQSLHSSSLPFPSLSYSEQCLAQKIRNPSNSSDQKPQISNQFLSHQNTYPQNFINNNILQNPSNKIFTSPYIQQCSINQDSTSKYSHDYLQEQERQNSLYLNNFSQTRDGSNFLSQIDRNINIQQIPQKIGHQFGQNINQYQNNRNPPYFNGEQIAQQNPFNNQIYQTNSFQQFSSACYQNQFEQRNYQYIPPPSQFLYQQESNNQVHSISYSSIRDSQFTIQPIFYSPGNSQFNPPTQNQISQGYSPHLSGFQSPLQIIDSRGVISISHPLSQINNSNIIQSSQFLNEMKKIEYPNLFSQPNFDCYGQNFIPKINNLSNEFNEKKVVSQKIESDKYQKIHRNEIQNLFIQQKEEQKHNSSIIRNLSEVKINLKEVIKDEEKQDIEIALSTKDTQKNGLLGKRRRIQNDEAREYQIEIKNEENPIKKQMFERSEEKRRQQKINEQEEILLKVLNKLMTKNTNSVASFTQKEEKELKKKRLNALRENLSKSGINLPFN